MKTSLALAAAAAFLALSAAAPDASATWGYTIPSPAPAPPPSAPRGNCNIGTACYQCMLDHNGNYVWNEGARTCLPPARTGSMEVNPDDVDVFNRTTCQALGTCPRPVQPCDFYCQQHAPHLSR